MIVDSHCHLNFSDFKDDLAEVVQRARDNGVEYLQTICTKLEEYEEIMAITANYDNVFCSVGVHPHDTEEAANVSAEQLSAFVNAHTKTISLGETGLDYYYEHSNRSVQKKLFLEHIRAASEVKVPLVIHTRDAESNTLDILRSEMKNSPFSAVIHCFTASKDFGYKCLDLGFYISVSGIATFKNAIDLQDAIKSFPIESLLVETDSPFLAPIPYRGKRNEPGYCLEVAKFLANLKGVSMDVLNHHTTENFFRLFTKAAPFRK